MMHLQTHDQTYRAFSVFAVVLNLTIVTLFWKTIHLGGSLYSAEYGIAELRNKRKSHSK